MVDIRIVGVDWGEACVNIVNFTMTYLTCVIFSSFAELGSMIPLNGGAQAYLAYSYGPLISYLYTWTAISLLKPCSGAIISLIFGCVMCCYVMSLKFLISEAREYLCRVMYHATQADAPTNEMPGWAIKLTAWIAILAITLINVVSNRFGSRTNLLFTILKVPVQVSANCLYPTQVGLRIGWRIGRMCCTL